MNSVARPAISTHGALDRFLRGRLLRQLDALRGGEVALHDALGTALTHARERPIFFHHCGGTQCTSTRSWAMTSSWSTTIP